MEGECRKRGRGADRGGRKRTARAKGAPSSLLEVLPTEVFTHVLSFLLPLKLAQARCVCSAITNVAPAAMTEHARRAGLPDDWHSRHRQEMPIGTPALHLLHILRHCGPVAQLVAQLKCTTGTTASLANSRLNRIAPELLSAGAEMLVVLLHNPSRLARCGALNALSKTQPDVLARVAPSIEPLLQDEGEFVRLAAINALSHLSTPRLIHHRDALEACRDDIRNDSEVNGGFVYRAVRTVLTRIGPTLAALGDFDLGVHIA